MYTVSGKHYDIHNACCIAVLKVLKYRPVNTWCALYWNNNIHMGKYFNTPHMKMFV